MKAADGRLERIIAEITSALRDTGDARFAQLQRSAIAMRSGEQITHMEQARGIAKSKGVTLGRSRWHG